MNPELIEKVTKLIVEKLQTQNGTGSSHSHASAEPKTAVKFWNHTSAASVSDFQAAAEPSGLAEKTAGNELITFGSYSERRQADSKKRIVKEQTKDIVHPSSGIENPYDPEGLKELISKTPARIGIGRAGLRPKTETWLKFRFDHAAAVDAVYGTVNEELLNRLDLFKVSTMVSDKEVYIRRPDYGRKLSEEAKQMISEKCPKEPAVQIIISDGLSSSAVEENVEDVYLSLQQSLKSLGIDTGIPFYIEKGRVAVMDDVGELLQPKVIVLLIGERPGLVSAESLSAYLCYMPRKGTIEADRMVISNIHKGGIPPVEAGAYIGTVVQKILKYEASGVSLVQKES
ncbi:ethanolamine ammonia-lyase subunit EutC [Neobacillus mesonae]|uniref:ethanolamine ammonia-lyase subunit EutC n=1 Tax=Neobacillus mesonae TaxID=1193713 RepID=UPI00203EC481|nr:ethanolamine ammonia-lyase subunit EutC [Neobacillus mesonae]MCM3568518.1 ethanolamine ammonia-lyase subunit EutC [Neobacillus mesonae]